MAQTDARIYKILSLDGGGIRGVFSASLLATLEKQIGAPISSHFDLIAGTSTGGLIALGLALGIRAQEILDFYERLGEHIFKRPGNCSLTPLYKNLFGIRHESSRLREVLLNLVGERRLGESRVRLVIPAWHRETERIHLYKTSHHPRYTIDYQQPAIDAALATTAAPTYFSPHLTKEKTELVDGGVWANNPIAIAATEAIGVLNWQPDQLKILSIGTNSDSTSVPRKMSAWQLFSRSYYLHLVMTGQSQGALGIAKTLTRDSIERKAIWRIDQTAPAGRYSLNDTARISELKDRGIFEARENLPELREHFFDQECPQFMPFNHEGE